MSDQGSDSPRGSTPPGGTPLPPPGGTTPSDGTPPPPPAGSAQPPGDQTQTPPPEPGKAGGGGEPTAGDSWTAGDPAPRKGRSPGLIAALIIGAIVLVGGAAIAATMFMLRGADEALATKVPASADVFGTIYLDPAASQKVNLFRLTEKFPALGDEEQLEQRLRTFLDDALEGQDVTGEDVVGWVGSQVGFAVSVDGSDPQGAVLVDADDEAQAEASLRKILGSDDTMDTSEGEYGGATVWTSNSDEGALAIVDGVVVFASSRAYVEDVIDTANGDLEALDGSARYDDALASLPEAKLAAVYVDVGALIRTALAQADAAGLDQAATAGLGGLDPEAFGGMGMSVTAQPNGLAMDLSIDIDSSKLPEEMRQQLEATANAGPNELFGLTPTDSYGVIASTGIDAGLEQALSQAGPMLPQLEEIGLTGPDGVIENLTGDAVLTVGPSSAGAIPTGAVLLGTEDEAGMQVFLDRIAPLLLQQLGSTGAIPTGNDAALFKVAGPRWQTETYEGVTITSLVEPELNAMGVRPAYAVTDGSGIIASSVEEIKKVIDTADGTSIETDTTFTEALGSLEGLDQQVMYLNVRAIGDAIAAADPSGTAIPPEVEENLEPIDALVAGSRVDTDSQNARMLLLIS